MKLHNGIKLQLQKYCIVEPLNVDVYSYFDEGIN